MSDDLPSFAMEVRPDGQRIVVKPIGELDLITVLGVREQIQELLNDGWRDVIVDLRAVTFMDSSGVHLLLDTRRAVAEHHAELAIVDGTQPVKQVLELTGVSDWFTRATDV